MRTWQRPSSGEIPEDSPRFSVLLQTSCRSHRFYLGKIGTGILMLITFGGLYIWTLIDFIFAVSGAMKDKDGKPIKNW